MHTKLLIDSIMRQTIVLIAQLSASAGVRTPLTHLADQVFLNLSKELEEQGVSRKVIADMFGLALRSYQRRVQRLQASQTEKNTTLWQAVNDFLQANGTVTRQRLFDRFQNDNPEAVGAVINDLVQSGLASRTGSTNTAIYAPTSAEARRLLTSQGRERTATALVWLDICHHPNTLVQEVVQRLDLEELLVERILSRLHEEGQLTSSPEGPLSAKGIVIDVGSQEGWETAVFDHFQAAIGSITSRLRRSDEDPGAAEITGGTTLSFEVFDGHPYKEQVLSLLKRVRRETDELFEKVTEENTKHPPSEDELQRVVFYFGQFIKDPKEGSR